MACQRGTLLEKQRRLMADRQKFSDMVAKEQAGDVIGIRRIA